MAKLSETQRSSKTMVFIQRYAKLWASEVNRYSRISDYSKSKSEWYHEIAGTIMDSDEVNDLNNNKSTVFDYFIQEFHKNPDLYLGVVYDKLKEFKKFRTGMEKHGYDRGEYEQGKFDLHLHEGPLDFMKKAKDAITGASNQSLPTTKKGALRMAKSKNPKIAQKGRQALKRIASKNMASPAGIEKRKGKMKDAIFDKWIDSQANFTVAGKEAGADEFNEFMNTFMAGKDFEKLQGSADDKNIRANIAAAVEKNFSVDTKGDAAKQQAAADIKAQQDALDQNVDDGQKQALGARSKIQNQGQPNEIDPSIPKDAKVTIDGATYQNMGLSWGMITKAGKLQSGKIKNLPANEAWRQANPGGAGDAAVKEVPPGPALGQAGLTQRMESIMHNKLMRKYLKETGQEIADVPNLHGLLSRHVEEYGAQIEDWKDQARLISNWLKMHGADPLSCSRPQQTSYGTYMYVFKFNDVTGEERWLTFDDEGGVADVFEKQPDVGNYS